MRLSKRILKSRAVHAFMVQLAACYIRFVFFTARKHYEIPENSASYMHGDANGIFAFWHGRMMLMPSFSPTARPMHVVISLHRDGVFISEVMRQFRFSTIAGSRRCQSSYSSHAYAAQRRFMLQGRVFLDDLSLAKLRQTCSQSIGVRWRRKKMQRFLN